MLGTKLDGGSYLALALLEEKQKGSDSKWFKYLDTMPTSFDEFPIFYTDEELEMLKNSSILQKINEKKEVIQANYELICSTVGFEPFSVR